MCERWRGGDALYIPSVHTVVHCDLTSLDFYFPDPHCWFLLLAWDLQASQAGAPPNMLTEEYGVYFRLRTGVKILVENCRADMTIWAFKEEIEKYEQGLPANESRLSYGGKPIVDTNTLGSVSVCSVTFFFVPNLKGQAT